MKKLIIFSVFILFFGLFGSNVNGQVVESVTPTYQTLDLSGTPSTNDFLLGIDCTDDNYIFSTIHNQGSIARISKSNGSVTIFDNNSVAAGEDWQSVVRHSGTGKLFINEKDSGKVHVFSTSSNTFIAQIPIPQDVSGGLVTYTSTREAAPNEVTVAEGGAHGNHNYDFGFGSFGELKITNGFVWQTIDYKYDFDSTANGLGVNDVEFHGIARIDPSTHAVTRYSIVGAEGLRGMTIDATDSTILWVVDNLANKVFKFDTNTQSVIDTINIPAGSKGRGIADDGTYLYVAMNESSGSGNSKILKILKSDKSNSVIDTGKAIGTGGSLGTFSVFIAGDKLVWTDESSHIGTILLSDNSVKTSVDTTGSADSNHYGCLVSDTVVIAGKGSAILSSFSLNPTSESSHGGSCKGDCYAPHLGNDENSRFFYDDGLKINNVIYEVKNVLHNIADKTLVFPVGQPVNFELKVQDSNPDNVSGCEIAMGIKKGHFVKQDATFIIGTKRTFDGVISLYEEGDSTAFRDVSSSIENIGNNVIIKTSFTPTKNIIHDMFAVECKDIHNYYTTYFFNHGIKFSGKSETGTPIFDYVDDDGRKHVLRIVDETLEDQTLAVDQNGNYWYGDFGSFWTKEYERPDMKGSLSKHHGYDRNDYFEFKAIKLGQELLAMKSPDYGFDSSLIQKTIKPSFSHDNTSYGRLHDPVPNMMNAQAQLAIKNEGKP